MSYRVQGTNDIRWMSILGLTKWIIDLLKVSPATLAQENNTTTAIYQSIREICTQYPNYAKNLFKTMLILNRYGGHMAHALEHSTPGARKGMMHLLAEQFRKAIGRPVIEGEVPSFAPAGFAFWAQEGWQSTVQKWHELDINGKQEFIKSVFDHNKGYNRASNYVSDWFNKKGTDTLDRRLSQRTEIQSRQIQQPGSRFNIIPRHVGKRSQLAS